MIPKKAQIKRRVPISAAVFEFSIKRLCVLDKYAIYAKIPFLCGVPQYSTILLIFDTLTIRQKTHQKNLLLSCVLSFNFFLIKSYISYGATLIAIDWFQFLRLWKYTRDIYFHFWDEGVWKYLKKREKTLGSVFKILMKWY